MEARQTKLTQHVSYTIEPAIF